MSKIKKQSFKYSIDFLKLLPRKGLRSSTRTHFFRAPSNHAYAKFALSYCDWLHVTLPLNLTFVTYLLCFHKDLKTFLFKQFVPGRS